MAFSYTASNAITLVSAFTKNTPTSAMQTIAADMVSGQIWAAYPWQWTLQQISPAIALVNGVQDYSVPSELYRFIKNIRITRTAVTTSNQIALDLVATACHQLQPELHHHAAVLPRADAGEDSASWRRGHHRNHDAPD